MRTDLTAGTDAERVAELERRSQLASKVLEHYGATRHVTSPRQQAINDAIDILQWGHVDTDPPVIGDQDDVSRT